MRPRYHTRKTRKESRTIPVIGDGDDAGKYYRCWNCGFICDADRDALGDSDSRSGVTQIDYVKEYPSASGIGGGTEGWSADGQVPLQLLTVSGGAMGRMVTLENEDDGTPKALNHHVFKPKVDSGCPFCGSKNWRGDYP